VFFFLVDLGLIFLKFYFFQARCLILVIPATQETESGRIEIDPEQNVRETPIQPKEAGLGGVCLSLEAQIGGTQSR
jgi:hypothetical protein